MAKKNFSDIIKEFEGKSYDELLTLAQGSLNLIARAFSEFAKDCKPGDLILPFIFTTLGVDGELSETEHKFLNDLFAADFDYEGATKWSSLSISLSIFVTRKRKRLCLSSVCASLPSTAKLAARKPLIFLNCLHKRNIKRKEGLSSFFFYSKY